MAYFRCGVAPGHGGDGADLIVTCSQNFAGKTITCTDGNKTYTQQCPSSSPYEVTFESIPTGTWTISGVISGQTFSTTITITDFTALLADIPDGSTVTPTDDIQIWLHCANIWDKTYTTINQVLSDTTTLLALISSNNAVDYMARSTSWASSVCANSTAMTYIGANDYCANKLLANSTWRNAICNSTYFESVLNVKVPTMTSNTTPSGVASASSYYSAGYEPYRAFNGNDNSYGWASSTGGSSEWLQYQFASAGMIPRKIRFFHYGIQTAQINLVWKVQGSNNGSTWTDIQTGLNVISSNVAYTYNLTNGNTKYKYYRFIPTSGDQSWGSGTHIQIWGR